jgi:hypothetical protein
MNQVHLFLFNDRGFIDAIGISSGQEERGGFSNSLLLHLILNYIQFSHFNESDSMEVAKPMRFSEKNGLFLCKEHQ